MTPFVLNTRILRPITLSCLYAVFVLPLFVAHSSLFPYVFPKVVAFEAIVILAALACVISLLISSQRLTFLRHPLTICFGIWICALVISALGGFDFWRSFWSTAERMNGIFFYLVLFLFYLVCLTVLRSDRDWQNITLWSAIISIVVAIGAISEFDQVASGARLSTSLGNPLYASFYALINFYIAIYHLFGGRGKSLHGLLRLCLVMALIANASVFIFSSSRSAYIAVCVIGIYSVVIFGRKLWITTKRILASHVIAGVALIFLFATALSIGIVSIQTKTPIISQFDRIQSRFLYDPERIALWTVGIKTFLEHPLTGVGLENFSSSMNKYWELLPFKQNAIREIFDRTHNAALDSLAATGLIASIPFFAVVLLIGSYTYRAARYPSSNTREVRLLFGPLLLAYASYSLFSIETPVLLVFCIFFAAYMTFAFHATATRQPPVRSIPLVVRFTALCIAGVFAYLAIPGIIEPILASRSAVKAYQQAPVNPKEGMRLYGRALIKHSFIDDSIRLAAVKSAMRVFQNRTNLNETDVQEFAVFAIKAVEDGATQRPQSLSWYVNAGQLYPEIISFDKSHGGRAIVFLNKGLALVPNHPILHHNLARVYLASGMPNEALKEIDRAIAYFANDSSYHVSRVEILLALHRLDEAYAHFEMLRASYPTNVNQARVIVDLLKQLRCGYPLQGLYDYLTRAIQQYPTDLNFRIAQILYETNVGNVKGAKNILKSIEQTSIEAAVVVRTEINTASCKSKP